MLALDRAGGQPANASKCQKLPRPLLWRRRRLLAERRTHLSDGLTHCAVDGLKVEFGFAPYKHVASELGFIFGDRDATRRVRGIGVRSRRRSYANHG